MNERASTPRHANEEDRTSGPVEKLADPAQVRPDEDQTTGAEGTAHDIGRGAKPSERKSGWSSDA